MSLAATEIVKVVAQARGREPIRNGFLYRAVDTLVMETGVMEAGDAELHRI